jgi:RNA polymerase sigma-70 factor (ECF subfamily)
LAAVSIRRELLDLAKHYYGPRGLGANYASVENKGAARTSSAAGFDPADAAADADQLAAWTDFHTQVERLPDEERAVFDLLWYQELSQVEAAELLNISLRTVKRRWASARLKLHQALDGALPDFA